MNNSNRILHITNFGPRKITDGGINREEALARFLADRGAKRIIVQDEQYAQKKLDRFFRLRRLKLEIEAEQPNIIVLHYPAYPFFWQHKMTRYTRMSESFARWLGEWARQKNIRVIIDVADLPLHQYEDIGLPMEMTQAQFADFDRTVFSCASELWVCSSRLADLVRKHYECSQVIKPVVNGSIIRNFQRLELINRPFRFVYCGSLKKNRSIDLMISAFANAKIPNAELHLAGTDGEWITQEFDQLNIIYQGSLTDDGAASLASQCDVGLIYYPQKGYYHLAFATKLPFYVCCGLPVLCTDVDETGDAVRSLGIGRIADIACFGKAMREIALTPNFAGQYEQAISQVKHELTWEHLFSIAFGETRSESGYTRITEGR